MASGAIATCGRTECRTDRPGRRGIRPARLLRIGHDDPGARRSGRRRDSSDQLPHHRPVLSYPGLPVDGSESPPQRHGTGGRSGHRFPRLLGNATSRERLPLGNPPGERLRHLRHREVAPQPGGRDQHGGSAHHLASWPGVRPVVRLPRRRDSPVHAGAVPRQPHRSTSPLGGRGVPPQRRSRRPRNRVPRRPARRRRRQALLPLLLHRGLSLSAPCASRVDRAVPRPVRPGVGSVARGDLRPAARARRHSRGHGPVVAPAVGALLGQSERPGTGPGRAVHGVLCRVPVLHRRTDRPALDVHCRPGGRRQHRRYGGVGQRGKLRGWKGRHPSTRAASRTSTPRESARCTDASRRSADP